MAPGVHRVPVAVTDIIKDSKMGTAWMMNGNGLHQDAAWGVSTPLLEASTAHRGVELPACISIYLGSRSFWSKGRVLPSLHTSAAHHLPSDHLCFSFTDHLCFSFSDRPCFSFSDCPCFSYTDHLCFSI